MDASAVASFRVFNGHLDDLGKQKFSFNSENNKNSSSESNDKSNTGKNVSCDSGAYDEDFVVNDDEDVTTPCTSPTLGELHRFLAAAGDAETTSPERRKISPSTIKKSLSSVASKPCQYPLEHLFDEAIPAQPRRWIKETIKRTADMCLQLDKVPISPRSYAVHPPVRPLDQVKCHTSPLTKLMSCSSGYLLGRLGDLPFQSDFLIGDQLSHGQSFGIEIKAIPDTIIRSETSSPTLHPPTQSDATGDALTDQTPDLASMFDTAKGDNALSSTISSTQSTIATAFPLLHGCDAEFGSVTLDPPSRSKKSLKKKTKRSVNKLSSSVSGTSEHQPSHDNPSPSTSIEKLDSAHHEQPSQCNIEPVSLDLNTSDPDVSHAAAVPDSGATIVSKPESTETKSRVHQTTESCVGEHLDSFDDDFTLVVTKKERRKQKNGCNDLSNFSASPPVVNSPAQRFSRPPLVNGNHPMPADKIVIPVRLNGYVRSPYHSYPPNRFKQPAINRSVNLIPSNSPKSSTHVNAPASSPKDLRQKSNQHTAFKFFNSSTNPSFASRGQTICNDHNRLISSSKSAQQHQRLRNFLLFTWNSFCTDRTKGISL